MNHEENILFDRKNKRIVEEKYRTEKWNSPTPHLTYADYKETTTHKKWDY